MLTQIKIFTRLELCNLYNLNVFRFSKDTKAKRKAKAMLVLWVVLIVMLCSYVGGLAYGLIFLGAEDVVPAYLIAIASMLIFFFGIFKAGSTIFRKNGYDLVCSLPVPRAVLVVSRFLRMYVENLAIAGAVLLPGLGVYAWFERPDVSFYVAGALGLLWLPLLPVAGAVLVGVLVTGISSRMKRKSLVEAALTVLVLLGILLGSSKLASMEGNITPEMLKNLSDQVLTLLGQLYPPAVLLGRAVAQGDLVGCIACGAVSFLVFGGAAALVCVNFHRIYSRLYSTSAKHNYQMEELKQESILRSLCKREFKRYFSSSIYVTNTIIGPVMGTVLCGMLLVFGTDSITETLMIPLPVTALVPFVMAGVFCMMTTTAVSISMEGKEWWILKSLPLSAKTILDAKILMNLLLMLPFYLLSEGMLLLALRPGVMEAFWLLVSPAVIMVFSCVYGIFINLHFPVLHWENETSVVKQSASAFLGGMGGFLTAILCAVLVVLTPNGLENLRNGMICILILCLTAFLYQRSIRRDLRDI